MTDIDEPEPAKPAFWTVAVYFTQRRYGGPEEGGWWFDEDVLVPANDPMIHEHSVLTPRIKRTIDAAIVVRDEMQSFLDKRINSGRRPLHSVLSDGIYTAMIHDGWPPVRDPMERPQWE